MLYDIKKGRTGKLIKPDGIIIDWVLSRDMTFDRDDMVVDSISLYNRKYAPAYPVPNSSQYVEAERLAKMGFTVFGMIGKNTEQKYMFAVALTENDSEMD